MYFGDVDELLDEYDDLTQDVSNSKQDFFGSNLRRWFQYIEQVPEFAATVQRLESSIDFDDWRASGLVDLPGMGPGKINLPDDRAQRLGALLGLFRSLTEDDNAAWRFAHDYISQSESNLTALIGDLVDQLFDPFARDLRRQLRRDFDESDSQSAPASDRVVTIKHNGKPYQDLVQALDNLSDALRGSNDYKDTDDQKQRIAEISAGKQLLSAPRTRISALKVTLLDALQYLARKFLDNAVSKAAAWAIKKLVEVIPNISSG